MYREKNSMETVEQNERDTSSGEYKTFIRVS